jgi:bifunctional UDP-N-acetylglucosamine pyrophosphorylase/glucosamine-1-phosphate N-acetyltransferase
LGTADAVAKALPLLEDFSGAVLVLFGADPLFRPETLRMMLSEIAGTNPKLAVLGFEAANPAGYGRLLVEGDQVAGIREEADCSDRERDITLCNSGIMAFDADILRQLLPKVTSDNAKGEFYLTDMVALASDAGEEISLVVCPESEVAGVNTRADLAAVEAEFQRRYREKAMEEGATLVAPETVFLSADTQLGRDVTIEPNVFIGPGVNVGDGTVIRAFCHLESVDIGSNAQIGPFARLRPGTKLADRVKIGNFVELKNAQIDVNSKVNHLSYVGDATLGAAVNIGAGTITCNYDGYAKHRTEIGNGAFIGSNSALVAPVTIGSAAYVGSGSVITKNVPDGALGVGRGRQENRPNWVDRYKKLQAARDKKSGRKD